MGDRNTIDMEIDPQGQNRIHPDPRFNMGNNANYHPHPNVYPVLPVQGVASNIGLRHFPNTHGGNVFYGNQINSLQHQNPVPSFNLGVSSSFSNPHMIPPSGGIVIGAPHVSSDQLPSMGHHGLVGVGVNGMNHQFMEGLRNSSKRKNAEMVPGAYQANGSASSSGTSLGMPPLGNVHPQSVHQLELRPALPDAPPIHPPPPPPPDYRVNGVPVAGRSGRSVRSRSNTLGLQMEPPVIRNVDQLAPRSYISQPFQPAHWAEPRLIRTGNDVTTNTTWNYVPAVPFLNGGSVHGGSVNRNSTVILNPPTHPHQNLPPPPPPHPMQSAPPGLQAMHVQNGFHLHQPVSFRQPVNHILPQGAANHSLDDLEIRSRHPQVHPSHDLHFYRPHRSGMQLPFSGNRVWPHMRVLTVDEVAILEGLFERSIDRHHDMRLDIDDMTYEELLDLGEQIGNVATGLPEETLGSYLKTRAYVSSATEGGTQETEKCIVCLAQYRKGEMIGILECGHEYHVDCIKRWLQVKNVCPICKLPAINVEDDKQILESPWTP